MKLRDFDRTRLIYYLRVFDASRGECLGHLADINTQGLMIICEKCLPVDTRFSLRMDLPKNLMADKQVSFTAQSKWCRKDGTGDFYTMGFSIDSIEEDVLDIVRELIRNFHQEEMHDSFEEEMNPLL